MILLNIITVTPTAAPAGVNSPQANLIRDKFDSLIFQKGYDVIKESAIKCPCVSKNTNQQSNCKNCGGSGWIFLNAKKTKMVMHSMNLSTKYKEWSSENVGTASISCIAEDELSFMDRITTLDGNAIFSEVLFVKQRDDVYYFNTIYNIKEILFIGLFIKTSEILKPLIYGVDFTYSENKIIFLTVSPYIDPLVTEQDISIAVRYKHAPQFHVIDIPRETMQTFNKIGGQEEGPIDLPIHAVARRSHYVLDRQNFDNTRILNNNHEYAYNDLNPPLTEC